MYCTFKGMFDDMSYEMIAVEGGSIIVDVLKRNLYFGISCIA